MTSRVNLHIDDTGVAHVELNRSDKLNALDMDMFFAIDNTIKKLKKNKSVRVVIVSGNGDDFSSGLDIKSVMTNKKNAIRLLFKWWPSRSNMAQRVSSGWRSLQVPVIMAIHGRCWGGGMQIALGGDFRIAHPDASLSIMEAKWGLIPDMGGNMVLKQLLPVDRAMELTMSAKQITGTQAYDLNLVTQVSETPIEAAKSFAQKLVQTSPDVLAATKKLYLNNWHGSDGNMLKKETWYQLKVLSSVNQSIAVKRANGKDAAFSKRAFK